MRFALVLLVACGSAPPTPTPITIQDPPPRPTTPAPVSCGDAGVIMRGTVENPKTAGPAKEAAIASACLLGKWSQETLQCIGGNAAPTECLSTLDVAQRELLDKKLRAWADAHDGESSDTISQEMPEVPCEQGIGDVATYAPVLRLTGEEQQFAVTLRRRSILAQCKDWPNDVRMCFKRGLATDGCLHELEADQQRRLADAITQIDTLMASIGKAKAKPATIDCKAVVAQHYSDAAWKGKAELPKNPKATKAELALAAQDRKQMIADSRKTMSDACTKEAWSPTLRACELVGGGELCAYASGAEPRWGFPAEGVLVRTGISECDAYVRVQQALMRCDKIPAAAKDAMKQSLEMQRQSWPQTLTDPNARSTVAAGCQQAEAALRQAAPALGCTI